jgi:hypothetical protein
MHVGLSDSVTAVAAQHVCLHTHWLLTCRLAPRLVADPRPLRLLGLGRCC